MFLCLILKPPWSTSLHIKTSEISSQLRGCCNHANGPQDRLFDCVNSSLSRPERAVGKPSIAVVTVLTSHVKSYASFAVAINAAYLEFHQHKFHIHTDEKLSGYDRNDHRWNKVKVVLEAMETWAVTYDYIVWIDADLVFLDFQFQIESILERYLAAEMIFSRDPNLVNGIVNTGCFIAKNSNWTKSFLRHWWSAYDRASGMDQHVFDKLWHENEADMSSHIALLAPDAINSHFPAWENQKPTNPILHLAGCSNILRQRIFATGFQELCRVVTSVNDSTAPMAPQLGLSRDVISEFVTSFSRSNVTGAVLRDISNVEVMIKEKSQFDKEVLQSVAQVRVIYTWHMKRNFWPLQFTPPTPLPLFTLQIRSRIRDIAQVGYGWREEGDSTTTAGSIDIRHMFTFCTFFLEFLSNAVVSIMATSLYSYQ